MVSLVTKLGNFVGHRKLGTLVASDSGVWLARDPDTVREPDVAFTSAEKIPLDAEIDGYAEVVPDLVVEIVSPSDSRRWARDRAQMWLDYGAPLVWIVHPDTRTIDVYRPGAATSTLHEDDSLDVHEVITGFTCQVSAIFV
ncbi:MAG: Uma2 family endonuclease [bacterium]|nr:Uma2 family endonuclease [bacterium]MDE0215595.1 Uma2 family endonuclease [bacterium]